MNLFNELGAELGTGDGDANGRAEGRGRVSRSGRPVRVGTVGDEEEMDLSDL